jgi:hypothetical protein
MPMQTIRTTFVLPTVLHHRLSEVAKSEQKTMSDLASDLLSKALKIEEKTRITKMYAALEKARGICKEPITDASTTIDEVLYGDNGAWRGDYDP